MHPPPETGRAVTAVKERVQYAPEAAKPRGRDGSRGYAASNQMTRLEEAIPGMRKRAVKGPAAGTAKGQALSLKALLPEMRKAAVMTPLALIVFWPTVARADWYGSEYARCEGTTAATVECLGRLTAGWQARLDDAYEALLAAQDTPARKTALEQAQRSWEAYRQANCLFYRDGSGSIAAIAAAECMRVLTSRRARELEQAANPESNLASPAPALSRAIILQPQPRPLRIAR